MIMIMMMVVVMMMMIGDFRFCQYRLRLTSSVSRTFAAQSNNRTPIRMKPLKRQQSRCVSVLNT